MPPQHSQPTVYFRKHVSKLRYYSEKVKIIVLIKRSIKKSFLTYISNARGTNMPLSKPL